MASPSSSTTDVDGTKTETMSKNRRVHWTDGENLLKRFPHTPFRSMSLEYFRPLCGRWMTDDGQFADDESDVTCDHCRTALIRRGYQPPHPISKMNPEHTKNLVLNMVTRAGLEVVEPIHVYEAVSFRSGHGRLPEKMATMATSLDLLRIIAGLDCIEADYPVPVFSVSVCAAIASGSVSEMARALDSLSGSVSEMDSDTRTAVGLHRWEIAFTDASGDAAQMVAYGPTARYAVAGCSSAILEAAGADDDSTTSVLVDDPRVSDPSKPMVRELIIELWGGVLTDVREGTKFVVEGGEQ